MSRERNPLDDPFQRFALDYWLNRSPSAERRSQIAPQQIPVNVYETEDELVVTAPMPGVEPEDIDVEVHGTTLTVRAALRGHGQMDRRYLIHEWTYGPYERSVTLPIEVDSQNANASHGNGILVLRLPKATRAKAVRIPLRSPHTHTVDASQSGHSGHRITREQLESDSGS